MPGKMCSSQDTSMTLSLLTVLLCALPADSATALKALESFGTVGACVPSGRIERHGEDHDHVPVAVAPVAALKGRSAEIIPWLAHADEAVVHRAATLLCFIQDEPSKAALTALIAKFPCRRSLVPIAVGAGIRYVTPSDRLCDERTSDEGKANRALGELDQAQREGCTGAAKTHAAILPQLRALKANARWIKEADGILAGCVARLAASALAAKKGCKADEQWCQNRCQLLLSDKNNCGACGNVCPDGCDCYGGHCAY